MQKVFSVIWSMDSKYIFSGSDETNIRVWKANASEKIGVKTKREETKKNYDQKLIEKY
jgi:WD repeat and SOF domain-containing protein 1